MTDEFAGLTGRSNVTGLSTPQILLSLSSPAFSALPPMWVRWHDTGKEVPGCSAPDSKIRSYFPLQSDH